MEHSTFGVNAFLTQGDLVTQGVALLLLLMSIASWYVMVTKAIKQWALNSIAADALSKFWDAMDVEHGLAALGKNNPFVDLAQAVNHHKKHEGHLHEKLAMNDWLILSLRQAIDESTARLQSGMAVLATVGSTAPFVGLFGTVWGIYHALISIGSSGHAGIEQVAGPVGEALIMTAFGLAVAIPASAGYNALVRGNKSITAKLNKFGFDLHALFITGSRTSTKLESHAKLEVVVKPVNGNFSTNTTVQGVH
jgi:biopolymer transport protein ExbB